MDAHTKADHKKNLQLAVKQHNDLTKAKDQCRLLREYISSLVESRTVQPDRTHMRHIQTEFKGIIAKVLTIERITSMDERALHREFETFRSYLRSKKNDHESEALLGALEHEQAVETIILTEEKQIEKLLRRALAYFLKYNRVGSDPAHAQTSAHMIIRILGIAEHKFDEALRQSHSEIEELKKAILA